MKIILIWLKPPTVGDSYDELKGVCRFLEIEITHN